MKAFRYMEMKICKHDPGHMTKMAAMPIYGKNPSKIFLAKGHVHTKIQTGFSQKLLGHSEPNFV